jgi:hypothetical protein
MRETETNPLTLLLKSYPRCYDHITTQSTVLEPGDDSEYMLP